MFREGQPAPGASAAWGTGIKAVGQETQTPSPVQYESPDAYRERVIRDNLPAAVAMETAKRIGGAVAGATVDPIRQGVEKRTALGTLGGIARGGFGAGLLTTPVGAAFLSSGMASEAAHEAEAAGEDVPAITKGGAAISRAFEGANAALPDFEKMRLESRRLGMPVAEAMSEVGQLANEALPIAVLGGAHEVAPRAIKGIGRAIDPTRTLPVPEGGLPPVVDAPQYVDTTRARNGVGDPRYAPRPAEAPYLNQNLGRATDIRSGPAATEAAPNVSQNISAKGGKGKPTTVTGEVNAMPRTTATLGAKTRGAQAPATPAETGYVGRPKSPVAPERAVEAPNAPPAVAPEPAPPVVAAPKPVPPAAEAPARVAPARDVAPAEPAPTAVASEAPRKVTPVAKNRFILQEQGADGMWRKSGEAKTAAEAQAWESGTKTGDQVGTKLTTAPAEVVKPTQPEPAQAPAVSEKVPTISDKAEPPVQAEPPLVAKMRAEPDAEARAAIWRDAARTDRAAAEEAISWARRKQAERGEKDGSFIGREAVERELNPPKPKKGATLKRKGREGPTVGMGLGGLGDVGEPRAPKFSADPVANAAHEAILERMTSKPPGASLRAAAKEAATTVYDRFVRAEGPLARAEKRAEGRISETGPTAMAKEAQGSSARKQIDLEKSGVLNEQPVVKMTIADALSKIPANEQRALSGYVAAKRFVTKYDPAELPTGVTPEQASAVVKAVESDPARASWVDAQKALHEYHRVLLRNLAEADRWDPARLAAIEEGNTAYAPIHRMIEAETRGTKGGTGPMRGASVKQVKGGDQPFADPFSTLRQDGQRMIAAADKARLKHEILDRVAANKDGWSPFMEEVPKDVAKRYVPSYDDIVQTHKLIERGAATPEQVARYVEDFQRATSGDVHAVWRGGELKVYRVTEPTLAEYMKGDTPSDGIWARAYEALASKVADPITRTQRVLTTGVRPAFWLWNSIKDAKTYAILGEEVNPVRQAADLARGYRHSAQGAAADVTTRVPDSVISRFYKRLSSEGLSASDQSATVAELSKYGKRGVAESAVSYVKRPWAIVGDGAGKVLDLARAVSASIEGGPRTAEAIAAARHRGVEPGGTMTTKQRIAISNRASEVTTNFRLGGKAAKQYNRFDAFFNARIQGIENARQAWVQHPWRTGAKTLAYSVIPEVALWAYTMSDEKRRKAYYALPAWRRATMTNLPHERDDGSIGFVSIPMLAEIDAPARAIRAALDLHSTGDKQGAMDAAKSIVGDVLPVTGAPSLVRPALEVATDHNQFTGRPINPPGSEGRESWDPKNVGGPGTSTPARKVSGALHEVGINLSAAKVDHLLGGYGGPATRDVARISNDRPQEAADTPIVGRLFPRESQKASVDRFYKMADLTEGRRETFLYATRNDAGSARKFVIPSEVTGTVGKIKDALKVLREAYARATTDERRRFIAGKMDRIASAGVRLMEPWQEEGLPKKPTLRASAR